MYPFNEPDMCRRLADETNTFYLHSGLEAHHTDYHRGASVFLKEMQSLSLHQLSNIKNKAGNTLDLVFTRSLQDVRVAVDHSALIEQAQQDLHHVPFEILVDCYELQSHDESWLELYDYKRGDCQSIGLLLKLLILLTSIMT